MDLHHLQIEAAVVKAAQVATGAGSAVAVGSSVAGITTHELIWATGVLCGSVAAIGGFVVTWYYKREENRRQSRIHRMREIEHGIRLRELNQPVKN